MIYTSLFEKLKQEYPDCFKSGSNVISNIVNTHQKKHNFELSDVLDNLLHGIYRNETLTLILETPRILRALIDFKIANSALASQVPIARAVDVCLDIYRTGEVDKKLESFKTSIEKSNILGAMCFKVSQVEDYTSWRANNPEYSERTANSIKSAFGESNLLFIPLGHGSYESGFDVFLRLDGKNNVLYPARFSRNKRGDSEPVLCNSEKERLVQLAKERRVVVYDEDACTGRTLDRASNYFSDLLKTKRILPVSNISGI